MSKFWDFLSFVPNQLYLDNFRWRIFKLENSYLNSNKVLAYQNAVFVKSYRLSLLKTFY